MRRTIISRSDKMAIPEIWIGLAEVVPIKGCRLLGEAKGAFVNVVAWADSDEAFYLTVEKAVHSLNMKLLELEDREPFSQRSAVWEVDESVLDMVERSRDDKQNVVFGDFHRWINSDA